MAGDGGNVFSPVTAEAMTSPSWRLPSGSRWTPLSVSGDFGLGVEFLRGGEQIDKRGAFFRGHLVDRRTKCPSSDSAQNARAPNSEFPNFLI